MKSLSIKQPWAWLIVQGIKDIENRTYKANYRGPLLIHTGKSFDQDGYEWLTEKGIIVPGRTEYQFGGIIGRVEMVDCITHSDSFWFSGPYGFVFSNPQEWPLALYRGHQGFFVVEI